MAGAIDDRGGVSLLIDVRDHETTSAVGTLGKEPGGAFPSLGGTGGGSDSGSAKDGAQDSGELHVELVR